MTPKKANKSDTDRQMTFVKLSSVNVTRKEHSFGKWKHKYGLDFSNICSCTSSFVVQSLLVLINNIINMLVHVHVIGKMLN